MICPNCGKKTKVTDTGTMNKTIYRRRQCKSCNYVFCTEEFVPNDQDKTRNALSSVRRGARNK